MALARARVINIGRSQEWLAKHAVLVFGSIYTFYGFAIYGALGALFPDYQPTLLYWSNWVQLWALPLLLVGTNLLGRDSERRSRETHDAVMEELAIAREEQAELARLIKEVHAYGQYKENGNRQTVGQVK